MTETTRYKAGLTEGTEWTTVSPRRTRCLRGRHPSVQWQRLRTAGACPWTVSWTQGPWDPCDQHEWFDTRETRAHALRPAYCSDPAMKDHSILRKIYFTATSIRWPDLAFQPLPANPAPAKCPAGFLNLTDFSTVGEHADYLQETATKPVSACHHVSQWVSSGWVSKSICEAHESN